MSSVYSVTSNSGNVYSVTHNTDGSYTSPPEVAGINTSSKTGELTATVIEYNNGSSYGSCSIRDYPLNPLK